MQFLKICGFHGTHSNDATDLQSPWTSPNLTLCVCNVHGAGGSEVQVEVDNLGIEEPDNVRKKLSKVVILFRALYQIRKLYKECSKDE